MPKRAWCTISVKPGMKVKIDREDLERVNERSWRVTRATTGRLRVVTSIRKKDRVHTITLGRFLLDPPRGLQVYPRRFQDELDYRKDNLIVCTLQERQQMLPKNRRNASSQYRGVSFSKSEQKWRAGIEVDGHARNLGSFDSENEAALAYNKAARKFFGKDAYQNSIGRKRRTRD